MRIAQVSPLYERVPPEGYGGTERVVSYLSDELVAQGHEVTLFATADSITKARLEACAPQGLRTDPHATEPVATHLVALERVFRMGSDFDVIHAHVDYLAFPFARRVPIPLLSTLHGRLDLEPLVGLYREYREQWVVSVSDAQRRPLPWLRWLGTVHHGLPRELYRFEPRAGDYLAFVGRISPEKRLDRAIEIARRADLPLRIAAKVDPVDAEYFRSVIRPLLDHPLVEFIGEVDDRGKDDLLGGARALLFPIDWPEPFGLIMIEALACGTPVIAWQHGSVAEVITHGVSGFLCDDVGAAVRAVAAVDQIERAVCRREFEERFSADRMAKDYLALYEQLAGEGIG
jgi:glycosyltransferase involved in cell wall biosynthesis